MSGKQATGIGVTVFITILAFALAKDWMDKNPWSYWVIAILFAIAVIVALIWVIIRLIKYLRDNS